MNSGRDGREDEAEHRAGDDRNFAGGWHERIRHGRYELFDPDGRLVIRRSVRQSDLKRFH